MSNLLVLVLYDLDKSIAIANAWDRLGVTGITLLDSLNMCELQSLAQRAEVPPLTSFRALFASAEEHTRTLFAVIEDNALLDCAITEAQARAGDFGDPGTGFLFVLPVLRVLGLPKAKTSVPGVRRAAHAKEAV